MVTNLITITIVIATTLILVGIYISQTTVTVCVYVWPTTNISTKNFNKVVLRKITHRAA